MHKHKTTILIIRHDINAVKSFTINTHLIRNLKQYILGTGALFTILLLIFFNVFYNADTSRFESRYLFSETTSATLYGVKDTLTLSQKMNKIANNLSLINNYLQERGILLTQDQKDKDNPYNDNYSLIGNWEEESVVFLNSLENTPIGFPYYGRLTSEYGYRTNPFGGRRGEFHPGVDLKGPLGDPVYATGDGIVEKSDWTGGYGRAVTIRHENGLKTLFGHLSRLNVNAGDKVKAGDLIGYIGSTGRSTGTHLHYEIRKNGEDVNPNPFLKLNL